MEAILQHLAKNVYLRQLYEMLNTWYIEQSPGDGHSN